WAWKTLPIRPTTFFFMNATCCSLVMSFDQTAGTSMTGAAAAAAADAGAEGAAWTGAAGSGVPPPQPAAAPVTREVARKLRQRREDRMADSDAAQSVTVAPRAEKTGSIGGHHATARPAHADPA